MEEMRKQFEAWICDNSKNDPARDFILEKFDNGKYQLSRTEDRWAVWQASRAALVVELPADLPCEGLSMTGMCNWSKNQMKKEIAASLAAVGITVKGEGGE